MYVCTSLCFSLCKMEQILWQVINTTERHCSASWPPWPYRCSLSKCDVYLWWLSRLERINFRILDILSWYVDIIFFVKKLIMVVNIIITFVDRQEWTNESMQKCSSPPARHAHSAVVYKDSMFVYGGMTDLQVRGDFWNWNYSKFIYMQCNITY